MSLRSIDIDALTDLQKGRASTVPEVGVSCAIVLGVHGLAEIGEGEPQTLALTREGRDWRQGWAA